MSAIKPKGNLFQHSASIVQFQHNKPINASQCVRHFSTNGVDNSILKRKYVPRRTLMYIPGHDEKKLRKIPHLGIDCAVLECEDGVALNKKVPKNVFNF